MFGRRSPPWCGVFLARCEWIGPGGVCDITHRGGMECVLVCELDTQSLHECAHPPTPPSEPSARQDRCQLPIFPQQCLAEPRCDLQCRCTPKLQVKLGQPALPMPILPPAPWFATRSLWHCISFRGSCTWHTCGCFFARTRCIELLLAMPSVFESSCRMNDGKLVVSLACASGASTGPGHCTSEVHSSALALLAFR
jgi:hypothetical protein